MNIRSAKPLPIYLFSLTIYKPAYIVSTQKKNADSANGMRMDLLRTTFRYTLVVAVCRNTFMFALNYMINHRMVTWLGACRGRHVHLQRGFRMGPMNHAIYRRPYMAICGTDSIPHSLTHTRTHARTHAHAAFLRLWMLSLLNVSWVVSVIGRF